MSKILDAFSGPEPWWAKLLVRFGAPMVLLGGVLYFLVTSISSNATTAAASASEALKLLTSHSISTQIMVDSTRRIEGYMWIDCIRKSKGHTDSQICGRDPRTGAE